jgi:hypothetical protein
MSADVKSSQVNLRLSPLLKARAERAAARDHRSLTSLIEKLLSDHLRGRVTLENWHLQAQARFDTLAVTRGQASLITPRRYRALSFTIHTADGYEIKASDLRETVSTVVQPMRTALTPQLFHVYSKPDLAPYFTSDTAPNILGDKGEILESALFADVANSTDFWRVNPGGFATHIRPYREDREGTRSGAGHGPGQWLCPFYVIRDLYEFVLFASLISTRFEGAESVEFRCEWWGLKGREIADADARVYWSEGKIARDDHRVTTGEWQTGELAHQPDIVSALASPLMRLFSPDLDCSPDFVGGQTRRFRQFG